MKRISSSIVAFAILCTLLCSQAFAAGETITIPMYGDYPEYKMVTITNVVAREDLPVTYEDGTSGACDYFKCDHETTLTCYDITFSEEFVAQYGVEPVCKWWLLYAPWDGNKKIDYMSYFNNFKPVNELSKSITLPAGKWVVCLAYSEGWMKDGKFAETGGGQDYAFFEVEGSSQASQAAPKFTDVDAGAYYAEPVAWAVEKGITSGTSSTTFSPDTTCTRAQIMTFLWRAAGSPEPKGTATVSDVKTSDYFYKAVLWAAENKMFSGTTFAPGDPCTRAMAVEFMWKHAGSPNASGSAFTDVPSDASYASAVSWALDKGVTAGTSKTTFSPDTACSRAQIVTFLYRGMK